MTMHRTRLHAAPPRLSPAAAEAWIPRTCFKHGPPGRVGVELELLVHDGRHPHLPTDGPAFDPLRAAARRTAVSGRVTVEPGGQIELSSSPHDGLPAVIAEVTGDLRRLRALAAEHGAVLTGAGLDHRRVRRRVLADRRYAGMEAYLDRWGAAGRTMMRRTASVQVNLEASDGTPGDRERRWALLHAVGPALVAAFANSPGAPGGPWADWASARMGVWLALDPARTREPRRRSGENLEQAWARTCLDAPLMLVRRPARSWVAPPATFREWLDGGPDVVPGRPGPDLDDLAYHLTTLFPPVRPRGHLEVRYLDAQPDDWWAVPLAVLWALVTDRAAGDRALLACTDQRAGWAEAARHGLRDDALAAAAVALLDAAAGSLEAASLDAAGGTAACARLVRAYRDHWTARGRCPADDRRDGVPVPPAPLEPPDPPEPPVALESLDRKDPPC